MVKYALRCTSPADLGLWWAVASWSWSRITLQSAGVR